MLGHLRRLIAAGALGAVLLVACLGSAVSVSADVSPATFQKLGCANGDLNCYQARLNGSVPITAPYCDNNGCMVAPVGDSVSIPISVPAASSTGLADVTIDPLAYQKVGCANGDLNCFYARLNGSVPITVPYCDNNGCTSAPVGDPGVVIVPPTNTNTTYAVPQPPAQGGIITALYH
jgi:hypothetical protein